MKIDPEQMRRAAASAEELLKALANRHRLMILCRLSGGEHSVGELAQLLSLRDSTMSQHLALLRKDGLVTTRRDGQTIWYRIANDGVAQIIETLYRIYCRPAQAGAPRNSRVKTQTPAKRKVSA